MAIRRGVNGRPLLRGEVGGGWQSNPSAPTQCPYGVHNGHRSWAVFWVICWVMAPSLTVRR